MFYLKIYAIILLGLIWGVQDFPAPILLLIAGSVFFTQLAVIVENNRRIFPDMTIQFALTATKVLFCVDLLDLFYREWKHRIFDLGLAKLGSWSFSRATNHELCLLDIASPERTESVA